MAPARTQTWQVYILRCRDGTLYTGATNDLERRLERHCRGRGAAYTRSRLPLLLIYSEQGFDRSSALRREAALKRLDRSDKLKLIAETWATSDAEILEHVRVPEV